MLRWEVLERRRENFYAYYWSLVGESNETALDYLKLKAENLYPFNVTTYVKRRTVPLSPRHRLHFLRSSPPTRLVQRTAVSPT